MNQGNHINQTHTHRTMTRQDKALLRAVLRDTFIFALKGLAFTISLGILAFVVFHVMAFR